MKSVDVKTLRNPQGRDQGQPPEMKLRRQGGKL